MSQSRVRRGQRHFERECARKGHELVSTGLGLARCSNCGETVSLLSPPPRSKPKKKIKPTRRTGR